MEKPLFREKSMERISSPEELHDYMRVTSPRIWMILSAIVVLLAGFIVYASTVNMESTIPVRVSVYQMEQEKPEGGTAKTTQILAMPDYNLREQVAVGMELRLGNETGKVTWMSEDAESNTLTLAFSMEHEYIPLDEGEYDAELVTESKTPISFLWN